MTTVSPRVPGRDHVHEHGPAVVERDAPEPPGTPAPSPVWPTWTTIGSECSSHFSHSGVNFGSFAERLHLRMELETLHPQLGHRPVQLLHRAGLVGVDACEANELLGEGGADLVHHVVRERREARGGLGVPAEQHPQEVPLLVLGAMSSTVRTRTSS